MHHYLFPPPRLLLLHLPHFPRKSLWQLHCRHLHLQFRQLHLQFQQLQVLSLSRRHLLCPTVQRLERSIGVTLVTLPSFSSPADVCKAALQRATMRGSPIVLQPVLPATTPAALALGPMTISAPLATETPTLWSRQTGPSVTMLAWSTRSSPPPSGIMS